MTGLPAEIISIWGIRDPLSMLTHLSGAVLAVLGLFVLLRRAGEHDLSMARRLGLAAYATSMVFAFTASAAFHYFPLKPEELTFFKKLDHAAIFMVIAGTATVLLNAGRTPWRRHLVAACWLVALGALVLKMIVWPMSLWMSAAVYLTVGWVGAASVLVALRHVAWDDLKLLVYGLLIFSGAAVVFASETPVLWSGVVEGHELFHLMVLAGTSTHFMFVLRHCTVPNTLSAAPERRRARTIGMAQGRSETATSSGLNLAGDPQGN